MRLHRAGVFRKRGSGGTLLTLINRGDALLQEQSPDWLIKRVPTYRVPDSVSSK